MTNAPGRHLDEIRENFMSGIGKGGSDCVEDN
jgi:hypothetical protein